MSRGRGVTSKGRTVGGIIAEVSMSDASVYVIMRAELWGEGD